VILVNSGSASASEIVAGALQDHDRGIILGTKTYGKGLVQSVIPLNYDASLKITTSKYYIPSGRCIQSERYDSTAESSIIPYSPVPGERIFRTLNLGRTVHEAGGITPDLYLNTDSVSLFLERIRSSSTMMRFVAYYLNTHPDWEFRQVGPDIRTAFLAFIDSTLPADGSALHRSYRQFLSTARSSELPSPLIEEIRRFEHRLSRSNHVLFDAHWQWLEEQLNEEFTAQIFGQQQRIASSLATDLQVQKARDLLTHSDAYTLVLKGSASGSE
jgi:carboxyl-terminal processing protease